MKKIISLLLCFMLFLSFTACKKDKEKDKKSIDLEFYATELCKIPEGEYALGANVDDVIKELTEKNKEIEENAVEDKDHSHTHDEQQFYFEVQEGEKNVMIDNGNFCYYYNKANKANGISYIVDYDTAFGIEIGTVILEVKEMLSKTQVKEEPLSEENAFFASYVANGTVLKAEFDGTVVLFVFQDNELLATAMYNENWSN